jgi:hypothetical protein
MATNSYPGRGYRETPSGIEALPPVGGAHGPAAIPSRAVAPVAPAPPATAGGTAGPAAVTRRGAVVAMAGRSPGLQNIGEVANELLHTSIAWDRPRYPNDEGLATFRAPLPMPSWTADSAATPEEPAVPIPVQEKQITNFTVRKPFGDTSTGELSASSYGRPEGIPIALPYYGLPGSPTYPTPATQTRRPRSGRSLQLRRWSAQAQSANPYMPRLTRWGQAGSYGSTTPTLPTAPASQYGAY